MISKYLALSCSGRSETCKWLVANDADLDGEDNMEHTPLELAEEYGHQDLANFLRTIKAEKQNPKSGYSLMRSSEKTQ
jgi:ankyrin repeat protein